MSPATRAALGVPALPPQQGLAGAPFRVLSHNLAGGTLYIPELIKRFKPDVLCLQEVKMDTKQLSDIVKRLNYKCESNTCPINPLKPGTALVWKSDLLVAAQTVEPRRVQILQGQGIAIMNVYAPSGSGNKEEREGLFSGEVALALRGLGAGVQVVAAGDWNCVLAPLDVEKDFRLKFSHALSNLVGSFHLKDAYRSKHPREKEFTFQRASVSSSRLDRLYVSQGLLQSVQDVWHTPGLSDHWVVLADFLLPNQKGPAGGESRRESNVWKLNTSILGDEAFLTLVKKLWGLLEEEKAGYDSVTDWWDKAAKPALREMCQAYSKQAAADRKEIKGLLYGQLQEALGQQDWGLVAMVKEQLRQLLLYEQEGVIIRSRYQQEVEEEQAGLFFVGRELKNSSKNSLSSLKVPAEE